MVVVFWTVEFPPDFTRLELEFSLRRIYSAVMGGNSEQTARRTRKGALLIYLSNLLDPASMLACLRCLP